MIYLIFLILSIIIEVICTLLIKYFNVTGDMTSLFIIYFVIPSSYILLAMSIKLICGSLRHFKKALD